MLVITSSQPKIIRVIEGTGQDGIMGHRKGISRIVFVNSKISGGTGLVVLYVHTISFNDNILETGILSSVPHELQ